MVFIEHTRMQRFVFRCTSLWEGMEIWCLLRCETGEERKKHFEPKGQRELVSEGCNGSDKWITVDKSDQVMFDFVGSSAM